MKSFIVGLDMGVTSIGGSVFLHNKIDKSFVSIFPEGVNVSPLGKEQSRNAERREKRMQRRQIFRKNQRKKMLLSILQTVVTNF